MNFARRQECNKCGAPKPGDAGGFGGGGGECFDLMSVLAKTEKTLETVNKKMTEEKAARNCRQFVDILSC